MSEYQQAVLGAILLDNDLYHRAGLIPQHFTDGRTRAVYEAISGLIEAGEPANLVTVSKQTEGVDVGWLSSLTDLGGGSSDAYLKRVKDEARHHWLWRLSAEAKERLEAGDAAVDIQNFLEDGLTKISLHGHDEVRHLSEGLEGFLDEMERRYEMFRQDTIAGVPTGFDELDGLFGGFEGGKLYYVGARPSQGKSALLLNFITAAAEAGEPVGLITLESSEREALARFTSQTQNVPNENLRTGILSGPSFAKIGAAIDSIKGWPVWVCDSPDLTLSQVKMVARKMAVVHKVKALYVDYLQYIRPDKEDADRKDQVALASRGLKALARRLDVPVICAAQLRRDADGREPHLGDFAESSQIEKDADVAMLLHHWTDAGNEYSKIIVAKNRDGETRPVHVWFDKEHARFQEVGVDRTSEAW